MTFLDVFLVVLVILLSTVSLLVAILARPIYSFYFDATTPAVDPVPVIFLFSVLGIGLFSMYSRSYHHHKKLKREKREKQKLNKAKRKLAKLSKAKSKLTKKKKVKKKTKMTKKSKPMTASSITGSSTPDITSSTPDTTMLEESEQNGDSSEMAQNIVSCIHKMYAFYGQTVGVHGKYFLHRVIALEVAEVALQANSLVNLAPSTESIIWTIGATGLCISMTL